MHVDRETLENLVVGHGSELASIQTHLFKCQRCQRNAAEMLEAGDLASPARIKVLDPIMSLGPSAPAQLLAASASGMHVRAARSIFIGALIQVRSSRVTAFGRVRYCIPAGTAFQIGVKLQSVC